MFFFGPPLVLTGPVVSFFSCCFFLFVSRDIQKKWPAEKKRDAEKGGGGRTWSRRRTSRRRRRGRRRRWDPNRVRYHVGCSVRDRDGWVINHDRIPQVRDTLLSYYRLSSSCSWMVTRSRPFYFRIELDCSWCCFWLHSSASSASSSRFIHCNHSARSFIRLFYVTWLVWFKANLKPIFSVVVIGWSLGPVLFIFLSNSFLISFIRLVLELTLKSSRF